jgi:hypothetical protein
VIPNKNPTKKRLQQTSTKIPRKSSENHQGEYQETKGHKMNHAKTSIHAIKGSYMVYQASRTSYPLSR